MKTAIIFTLFLVPSVCLSQDVVPVEKDQPAPFTGLLVPEVRFTSLIDSELKAKELTSQLKSTEQLMEGLEKIYLGRLREATRTPDFWERPETQRWTGFILGVVVTTCAIWAGAKFSKTF